MSIGSFERYPLLFGPSPVHRLERLSAHLGGAPVWAKREDCNSGIAYGGNKTRKLEYLVADALAGGCDTLVSIGGVQSNHTHMVAAVAAKIGMKCHLVQESWLPLAATPTRSAMAEPRRAVTRDARRREPSEILLIIV
jgi:1-aminocyclopropane-1-carboxylate deaminase